MSKNFDKEYEFGSQFGVQNIDFVGSSDEQDMIEHWDIGITDAAWERKLGSPFLLPRIVHSGDLIKVDVKKHPKGEQSEHFRWIELKNVLGDKGWLYGCSDYIGFEHHQHWLVADTRRLARMIEAKRQGPVTHKNWRNPEPYHTHTRKNKDDLAMQVPIIDIKSVGFILDK